MHPLVNNHFNIRYCIICKDFYVQCPKCGMNTCSGGYGEGHGKDGKCTVCPIAYKLDEIIRQHDLQTERAKND